MTNNYKIFVIYHQEINPEYYPDDIIDKLIFTNVTNREIILPTKFTNIRLDSLEFFTPLGKYYTESEVIFNIYLNQKVIENIEYVGFVHHDMDLRNFHEYLFSISKSQKLISAYLFQPYIFKHDYEQKILMDIDRPNILKGKGKNCYISIFNDYNSFYQKNLLVEDFFDKQIGLCSSFLVQVTVFNDMMAFISDIITSGKLDSFDKERKYRIQGGLLERYYGVWFLLSNLKTKALPLPHSFYQTKKDTPIEEKINLYLHSVKISLKKLIRQVTNLL
jgi:hypothetical protein